MASAIKTWLWAQDLSIDRLEQKDLERAYNLDRDGCSTTVCKRNCVQKPRCLYWMGEKKWLEKDAEYWNKNEKVDVTLRHNQDFCGLRNLGATCYVNSLLQVLFHNEFLRRAIYLWNPSYDTKEASVFLNQSFETLPSPVKPGTQSLEKPSFQPKSPIGQLQWVFARLQFGSSKYVDPTPFVKSLDLDVSQQQDAQEFCKLFLNLLEEDLASQPDTLVKNVVQNEYQGEYNYETKCLVCESTTRLPSKFYELSLNIEGNKSIQECLRQFVESEMLEGSNSYFCSSCDLKQTAARSIRLSSLPPTLNLQLMRFVYDRTRNTRKKLNTAISFPEKLDMAEYLSENAKHDESTMYQLTAVLVHFGNSAHSGHYIAHIKDAKTGSWYKFNDERVEKLDDLKSLKSIDESNDIEIVDELIVLVDGTNKAPKKDAGHRSVKKNENEDPPGTHSSKNAYMLVYSRCSREQKIDIDWSTLLPESLSMRIGVEKSAFDKWSTTFSETQKWIMEKYRKKQAEVKKFYADAPIEGPNMPKYYMFIPKDWLALWLKATPDQIIPPVDNSGIMCSHGCLDFTKLSEIKCISDKAGTALAKEYSITPRLTETDLCLICVQRKIQSIQLRQQILEDAKKVTELSKDVPTLGNANYWVGIKCFKNWRSLAQDDSGDDGIEVVPFNEEIICKHGKLNLETSSRKVVTGELWSTLRKYFPKCHEFLSTSPVCEQCQADQKVLDDQKYAASTRASDQKTLLNELFYLRKRPQLDLSETASTGDSVNQESTIYVISQEFFKKWKLFVDNPTRHEAPTCIKNIHLLCPDHRLLLYPLDNGDNLPNDVLVLISWSEWAIVSKIYPPDVVISVDRSKLAGDNKFISTPRHCQECYAKLLEEQRSKRLQYKNASIFIRRIQTVNLDEEEDEDSENKDTTTVHRGRSSSNAALSAIPLINLTGSSSANASGNSPPRRSTRLRRGPDQKELAVCSEDTLKDLKIRIMEMFKVPTFDQNLSLAGSPLTDNTKTLAQLSIFPESTLELRVDVPDPNAVVDEKGTGPETGFKGTRLIR